MLRKMYLVRAEQRQNSPAKPPKRLSRKPKRPKPRSRFHPYDKWVKVRGKICEDQLERDVRVKAVADFLKSVLPQPPTSLLPAEYTTPQRQSTPTQT